MKVMGRSGAALLASKGRLSSVGGAMLTPGGLNQIRIVSPRVMKLKVDHPQLPAGRTTPWRRATQARPFSAEPIGLSTPTRPHPVALAVSRVIDLAVAASLACLFAVPMILVAALVKLTSRGPIIYKQERLGLGGKSFVMYKFRTMRVDAEIETGPIWSKRGDPRCTRVGAVLRRFSLDELPQLLNVLRGEMSLVGPRPERPYFVHSFSQKYPAYSQRLRVLPGITGWAQVNGWRGDSSLEKRLEHDLYYIEHWSLGFNLRIMLQTPFNVFVEPRVG